MKYIILFIIAFKIIKIILYSLNHDDNLIKLYNFIVIFYLKTLFIYHF